MISLIYEKIYFGDRVPLRDVNIFIGIIRKFWDSKEFKGFKGFKGILRVLKGV